MKETLYKKCQEADFKSIFANKGYAYFTKGFYNLNIIGVRSNQHNKVTNKFDDYLIVEYNTPSGHRRDIYLITTEPGLKVMRRPSNSKGTAILVPGQYRGVYKLDLHNGKYKALCQRLGPVKVYRDSNKDNIYDLDPKTIDTGYFGINLHRAGSNSVATTIDGWSAGCQVFSSAVDFRHFIKTCEESASIYGNKFTYTLITEDDLK